MEQAMKVWQIETIRGAPVLASRSVPVPAKGESVVRVMAAGLNFADLLMIDGTYQACPPLPYVPGLEFAGVVEAMGAETSGTARGTRVLGTCAAARQAGRRRQVVQIDIWRSS